MIDYVDAVAAESARFIASARQGDMASDVPSCPGWNLADLIWHLAEVQHFWGDVVEGLVLDPDELSDVDRPGDDELADLFDDWSARLVRVLEERSPEDACWSWHPAGGNVGWVRRRQAHEALIHRVDAELVIDSVNSVGSELAADGVAQMLTSQIDSPLPDWATFVSDGLFGLVRTTDVAGVWGVEFGRFQGTSPLSGTTHDIDTLQVIDPPSDPVVEVAGSATEMDLWLWGRGSLDGLSVVGDRALVERIRSIAAEATN